MNFCGSDLVTQLKTYPSLMALVKQITYEAPVVEDQSKEPYIYLNVLEPQTWSKESRQALVTVTVVQKQQASEKYAVQVLDELDSIMCQTIDGCLPMRTVGNIVLTSVTGGYRFATERTDKGRLIIRKDYSFWYIPFKDDGSS